MRITGSTIPEHRLQAIAQCLNDGVIITVNPGLLRDLLFTIYSLQEHCNTLEKKISDAKEELSR